MRYGKMSSFGRWLKKSVWAFPILLFVLVCILAAFKISGTSVGIYHQALYGASSKDPNLIYGEPRAIRSDEWLSGSQFLVSQSKNDFPRVNTDLGSGRDLSTTNDMPIKSWLTVFRPQNWAFFVLPLENAFAFRWWLLMYLLIISCYFFTLRILPGKKMFAAVFSVALGLAPFELWWYQVAAFLSIAYGFMMLILIMRILNNENIPRLNKRQSGFLHLAGLAFVIACFGLIIYPPFQIPIAIVVLFFAVGSLLHKRLNDGLSWRDLLKRLGLLVAATLAAAVVGIAFIVTEHSVISSLNHTLYPGARTISSGSLNFLKVFDSFMQPQLQNDFHGQHFLANQSEDSNFILLLPFTILPGLFLSVYEYVKKRRIDWVFLMLQLCALMFFARAFIHFGDPFYKLFMLQKVPNERLLIGFGFVGILQLLYLMIKLPMLKNNKKVKVATLAGYGLICLGALLWIGHYTIQHYPLFIDRRLEVLALAAAFTAVIVAFLANKKMLAVCLLLLFTLGSSFRIIPLYRGLGFDSSSAVAQKIDAISSPQSSWGAVNIPLFQNMGLLAGRHSITGTQVYPDMKFWHQYFGSNYNYIFNRQAHAMLSTDDNFSGPVYLVQRNFYEIKLDCTSRFIRSNLDFALSIQPLNVPCAKLAGTVKYPELTVYLYKMSYHGG